MIWRSFTAIALWYSQEYTVKTIHQFLIRKITCRTSDVMRVYFSLTDLYALIFWQISTRLCYLVAFKWCKTYLNDYKKMIEVHKTPNFLWNCVIAIHLFEQVNYSSSISILIVWIVLKQLILTQGLYKWRHIHVHCISLSDHDQMFVGDRKGQNTLSGPKLPNKSILKISLHLNVIV